MIKANRPWGQQLLLNFAGAPRQLLTRPKHVNTWVRRPTVTLDMRVYGEPSRLPATTLDRGNFTQHLAHTV